MGIVIFKTRWKSLSSTVCKPQKLNMVRSHIWNEFGIQYMQQLFFFSIYGFCFFGIPSFLLINSHIQTYYYLIPTRVVVFVANGDNRQLI